jgi:hypothetical protein
MSMHKSTQEKEKLWKTIGLSNIGKTIDWDFFFHKTKLYFHAGIEGKEKWRLKDDRQDYMPIW